MALTLSEQLGLPKRSKKVFIQGKPESKNINPSTGIIDQGIGTNISGVENPVVRNASINAGIGTGGNSNAIKDTGIMTQGLGYQEGISGDINPGFGSYQEGISGDINPGFGGYQAPRSEYFGPTNWNPGIGNQYHAPKPFEKLNLEEAVKASKGGRGSRGNRLADIETSKGGRGSKGKHWADDIIDWKGHPSAGVTYPEPPSSYDPRIDGMIKEVKGRDESVFTTIDDLVGRGGYTPEEIMAGTDKSDPFWMSQDGVTDTPVDLGLTDAQVEQILNPSISGESFIRDNPQYAPIGLFDEPLYDGGTFAESPFVGPHDYATGNIQDASSSVDPRVLAGLNQQAIGHMTDPSGIAGYAAGLPQPEVYEAPKGVVDPRHMKDYYEMIGQTGKLPAGIPDPEPIFTGPQGVAPVDERVDLSRQNVPLNYDDRIQRIARAPRPQTEEESQMEMVKFYQSIGDNERANVILRAIGSN